jgi:hypothetical protein
MWRATNSRRCVGEEKTRRRLLKPDLDLDFALGLGAIGLAGAGTETVLVGKAR